MALKEIPKKGYKNFVMIPKLVPNETKSNSHGRATAVFPKILSKFYTWS